MKQVMAIDVDRTKIWNIAGYEPHPKQMLFHNSKARFKVAASGRRFGKSQMAVADLCEKWFIKGGRGWIVADTYYNGDDEFTYLEDMAMALFHHFGVKPKGHSHNTRSGDMHIEWPWGGKVEVKSADRPGGLVGKGLTWVIMTEAAKQDYTIWDKHVRPALADYRAPAIFPSTPEGDNWFKIFYEQGQPTLENGLPNPQFVGNGAQWEDSWESWNFPAWENPYIYPDGFDDPEIRAQMKTPEGTATFWQEIGARFDVMVGKIYREFNKDTHVLKAVA